jgi:hypothetical protein
METQRDLLLRNASWNIDFEFVTENGNITPNKGTMVVKKLASGRTQLKLDFTDDNNLFVSIVYDIRSINNFDFEFSTNSIEGVGVFKGMIHRDRNVFFTTTAMGAAPLYYYQTFIVESEEHCRDYGCIFYGSSIIKNWQAFLTRTS